MTNKKELLANALLQLPALLSTDGKPKTHKVVVFGTNGWVWEAFEAGFVATHNGGVDVECFGLVHGFEKELGSWMLSDLLQSGLVFDWQEVKEKSAE